jgi:Putative glucoamylase
MTPQPSARPGQPSGCSSPTTASAPTRHTRTRGSPSATGCATEDVVTPHAAFLALDPAPEQAYANIQALRSRYPGVYGADGFFDALNPVTGAVGHRYLVLDQSMIMAALDNALANRALQRYFAADPVAWAAHTYLGLETMSCSTAAEKTSPASCLGTRFAFRVSRVADVSKGRPRSACARPWLTSAAMRSPSLELKRLAAYVPSDNSGGGAG